MLTPGLSHIVTFPPSGAASGGLSLSHIAHVGPPTYSFTTPGGCDQLTATLYKEPRDRTEALNPGRIVKVYRGGSVVWRGVLDEPTVDTAWQITAHGDGTLGVDYNAIYSVSWGTGVFNDAIDQAIGRGLPWVRFGDIGAVGGIWAGQVVDNGAQTITDLLNLGTSKGGLTWQVKMGPGDQSRLSVFGIPTTPNRILIATSPASQTIADGPNALYLRYQSSADGATKATYGLTSVTRSNAIAAQGRREGFTDISSSGTLTAGAAQTVGTNTLKRFTRASFTDPFTVQYGQLTNMGGVPVDLGTYYGDGWSPPIMVMQVLLSDFAFSGELTRGPVILPVGSYEWNDDTMVATITPLESVRNDFATLLSNATDGAPGRHQPITSKKKKRGKK